MGTTADEPSADKRIQATVVSYEAEPDQCTLHPVEADEHRRTTEWITAKEGSFVTVDSWR